MIQMQPESSTVPPSILLVDDSPGVLYTASKILTHHHFTVTTAQNAYEALSQIKENSFDLVVCDINMPGQSGLEFLNDLKQMDPTIASVVLTANTNATVALAIEAMKSGALGFVTKPFKEEQLIEAVNTALEQARLVRSTFQAEFYTRMLESLCEALLNTMEVGEYTNQGSSQRVARYSRAIANALGLSPDEVFQIYLAGLFHDIGKIGVPDHILKKVGPLTSNEVREISRHPEFGTRIIEQAHGMTMAANIVLHHHEWYDGTGYPDQWAGENIPLGSRIVAIGDVYDELTSNRIYAPIRSHAEAIEELKEGKGTQFDPNIVDLALIIIEAELLKGMKDEG